MQAKPPGSGLHRLLAHSDWLRGLAICLVSGREDAEDLVQETWIAAMKSPPDPDRPARPWLAEVMRNLRRMTARATGRRQRREDQGQATIAQEVPGTEALLARLELHRLLARLVTELDEPYRTTVLLRFFEGRTAQAIADSQGIPPATVRWRLREGLKRLRQRLDEMHAGDRSHWSAVLLPVGDRGFTPGAALVHGPAKLVLFSAGALALVIGVGAGLTQFRRDHGLSSFPPDYVAAAVAASPRRSGLATTDVAPSTSKGDPMHNVQKAAVLFGVVLPALVANAQEASKPLSRDEAISACLDFKPKAVVCKEELADLFAAMATPDRRAKVRERALKEIVDEGTGPIEARRNKCTIDVDQKEKGHPPFGILTRGDLAAAQACDSESNCKERVACWTKVLHGAKKRPQR